MPFLHIANTFFETELSERSVRRNPAPSGDRAQDVLSIQEAEDDASRPASLNRRESLPFDGGVLQQGSLISLFEKNPIFLQLQFLPILYGSSNDGLGVSHAPDSSFKTPQWHLLSDRIFPYSEVESWGASPAIESWAQQHQLLYRMPSWNIVTEVNSKAFSFQQSPKLPGAALIHTWEELQKWDKMIEGPKVLKTCFGVSGRGHLLLPSKHIEIFAQKEFRKGRPIIAEPWFKRTFDFSTQWKIDQTIQYLGATICISNQRGSYDSTIVGESIFKPHQLHLEKHREVVFPILQKIQKLGYFGNVGVDAMIWGDNHLHPIVEINARKTMGWVALEFSKHRFPKQTIRVSYLAKQKGDNLLPNAVTKKDGTKIHFNRKLTIDLLAN